MSKDEFILKINNSKVDFTNIKGGIKREDIKDEKMQTIFDSVDTDRNHELSDTEINTFFGLVKEQAQKHNSKNLGNKEYKKLLKQLEENGITIENTDKNTFLQFLSDLKQASEKSAEASEATSQEAQQATNEEKDKSEERENLSNKTTKVIVQLSETPEKLAEKFDCTADEIKELNKNKLMKNGKWFRAGDEIVIPKEIAPELLEGRKSSKEVNEEYRQLMIKRRAKKSPVQNNGGNNAPNPAGGNQGNAAEQKFTTEQIKTTVIFNRYSETQIKRYKEEGLKIAAGEKGIETLNSQNVAYAIVHDDKYAGTKTAELIFNNLVKRMVNLGIFVRGKDYGTFASLSKLPAEKQNAVIHSYALRIRNKDSEHLNAPKEAEKQKKVFDEANKFLVDMANSKNHLGAKKWLDNDENVAYAVLEDGREIKASIRNGDIDGIFITYRTNHGDLNYDVYHTPTRSYINPHFDHSWRNGNAGHDSNFNELKKVAEAIFADFLNKEKS